MQKTIAAAAIAILAGIAGAANAADIFAPGSFKDGPAPVYPAWTGWYLGGAVGGAWDTLRVTDETNIVHFSNSSSGIFGGGQFGFLYQIGPVVMGPEVDLGELGLSHAGAEPGNPGILSSINSGFYGDLTGRLGYSFGPALLYAKGGYVYYGGDISINDGSSASQRPHGGYTVGGGVEYRFNPDWSVKAEYQHLDFSSQHIQILTPNNNTYDVSLAADTVKLGLNYHFGICCGAPLK